jgi:hypothetical protein
MRLPDHGRRKAWTVRRVIALTPRRRARETHKGSVGEAGVEDKPTVKLQVLSSAEASSINETYVIG